jgi:cytochrome b pre-mRNA-processing protein 3
MRRFGIFGKSAANEAAGRILVAAMQASRAPALYGDGRVPDTMDGRFEIAAAFASLALMRLNAAPDGGKVAQLFTDKLFRLFDAGLRESGVGDLSVARRMKGLAGAFYGRLAAYREAIGDERRLAEAFARNVWNAPEASFANDLARIARALHERQGAAGPSSLETPDAWRFEA